MDELLVERFFDEAIPEEIKNRVTDVLVLADFSVDDDEAVKIRVIVDELIPNSFIKSGEFLPASFEGHPIEVFDEPPFLGARYNKSRLSDGARYHEVIRPGIACGGRGTTNGTLGAIVFDLRNNGAPCILSNFHVLRGRKRIFRGRTTDIFQPGKLIGGTPSKNVVATFERLAGQRIDAAIGTLNDIRNFNAKVLTTDVQFTGVRAPKVGDVLEKSGSRTGVTRGQVKSVSAKRAKLVPVGGDTYDAPDISKSGDSGSVWYYPESGEAAMLHTYGDGDRRRRRNQEWASGFLMTAVTEALDISLTPT